MLNTGRGAGKIPVRARLLGNDCHGCHFWRTDQNGFVLKTGCCVQAMMLCISLCAIYEKPRHSGRGNSCSDVAGENRARSPEDPLKTVFLRPGPAGGIPAVEHP
mgnify:CR=1 FL=1